MAAKDDRAIAPVVLVTGASGSIGGAVAATCAGGGATVLVHGRSPDSARAAERRLREETGADRVAAVACDFLDDGAIPAMLDHIDARFGRLDGIVNCAVSAPPGVTGPFLRTDPSSFGALCLHAIATLQHLCRAALPLMARGGGGSIVAMVSDAALYAAPNQSLIAATRAGIVAFCRNLALEVARDGIRINCISSSYVEGTRIARAIEAGGPGRLDKARNRAGLGLPVAEDIAALAVFLLGPSARRMTGQTISVNGGLNA